MTLDRGKERNFNPLACSNQSLLSDADGGKDRWYYHVLMILWLDGTISNSLDAQSLKEHYFVLSS